MCCRRRFLPFWEYLEKRVILYDSDQKKETKKRGAAVRNHLVCGAGDSAGLLMVPRASVFVRSRLRLEWGLFVSFAVTPHLTNLRHLHRDRSPGPRKLSSAASRWARSDRWAHHSTLFPRHRSPPHLQSWTLTRERSSRQECTQLYLDDRPLAHHHHHQTPKPPPCLVHPFPPRPPHDARTYLSSCMAPPLM